MSQKITALCLGIVFFTLAGVAANSPMDADLDNALAVLVDSLVRPLESGAMVRIGVLPFSQAESATAESPEGRAIAEKIIMGIVGHPGKFSLVDRMDYQKALKEIALSQSGVTAPSFEVDAGKFMAAQYLISGTVSAVMGQSVIRARTVHVESGEIVAAAQAAVGTPVLSRATADLFAEQQSVASYAFRSVVVPGWGQFYAQQPVRGAVSLVAGAGGAGFTIVSWVLSVGKRVDRDAFIELANTNSGRAELESRSGYSMGTVEFNTWFGIEKDRHHDAYARWQTIATIATAATAGVWILNVVDAAIAGRHKSRSVRLYFSASPQAAVTRLAVAF